MYQCTTLLRYNNNDLWLGPAAGILDAKQKHLGCKKSARPIRSSYKRPKTLISSKAKKLNILLRILSLE